MRCTDLICPASCDGALQQEQHFLRGQIQGSQALGQGDAGQDWAPSQLAQQLQMQGSCLSQILRMQVVLPAHTQQDLESVHPPKTQMPQESAESFEGLAQCQALDSPT